jgi:hypothetical protein
VSCRTTKRPRWARTPLTWPPSPRRARRPHTTSPWAREILQCSWYVRHTCAPWNVEQYFAFLSALSLTRPRAGLCAVGGLEGVVAQVQRQVHPEVPLSHHPDRTPPRAFNDLRHLCREQMTHTSVFVSLLLSAQDSQPCSVFFSLYFFFLTSSLPVLPDSYPGVVGDEQG